MQPLKISTGKPAVLYLFYDFETQQTRSVIGDEDKKVHVPNLCVVQQVCTFCLDIEDISIRSDYCGVRQYVFNRDPVKQLINIALAAKK